MAVAPKDGHLYGYDLSTNQQLYRVPVNKIENADVAFTPGQSIHFCPGPVGGDEWNSPAYVRQTNLILVGQVDWCYSVTVQDDKQFRGLGMGQPWDAQKIAVAYGFTMLAWPVKIVTAKVAIMGVDSAAATP